MALSADESLRCQQPPTRARAHIRRGLANSTHPNRYRISPKSKKSPKGLFGWDYAIYRGRRKTPPRTSEWRTRYSMR